MMMNEVMGSLTLTMETVVDFGGSLPTLDLRLWVTDMNITLYIFFEKPMASSLVIQRCSAMPENMRMATLNQEVVRRMTNTSERVEMAVRVDIIDTYCQKLCDSGYGEDQTRKVITGGLTRYERRLEMSKNKADPSYRPLHEGAQYNAGMRLRKKILNKSNWFKKKREPPSSVGVGSGENEDDKGQFPAVDSTPGLNGRPGCNVLTPPAKKRGHGKTFQSKQTNKQISKNGRHGKVASVVLKKPGGHGDVIRNREAVHGQGGQAVDRHAGGGKGKKQPPTISVVFVEQTVGGRLARLLQEAEDGLAEMTGFRIRVTETSGAKLCHILPNTNPWAGMMCGREKCFPCHQGTEEIEDCRRRNILYESSCSQCKKEHDQRYGDKANKE